MGTVCHPMLKEVAIAMAHEIYDNLAMDDHWYRANRNVGRFVANTWPRLIEEARMALAKSLGEGSLLPEGEKQKVAEALIKDNELRYNRKRIKLNVPQTVN